MTVHYEFRDDGRIAFVRDAAGKVLQDTFNAAAKPSSRTSMRYDAADSRGGHPGGGAGVIRSSAALRAALGEYPTRRPRGRTVNPVAAVQRYDGPAAAVVGPVRSADELRQRLGMARR